MSQAEGEFPVPVDASTGFACDLCDYIADSKFKLGGHKFGKHGVRSANPVTSHKKKKPATVRKPRTPREPTVGQLLGEVESSLAEAFAKSGALMLGPMPVPGEYLISTGDEAAATITRIAARHPGWLGKLEGAGAAMDYFALGTWGAGLAVAVLVNVGKIPYDSAISKQWGLDEIAEPYAKAAADAGAAGEDVGGAFAGAPAMEPSGNGAPSDVGAGSALLGDRTD